VRTGLEIGFLYGTTIAYGVGVGIWVDAEAYHGKTVDPGIALIAPVLFGAAMPLAVFLADRHPMREGLPSAIASGLIVGAGEGLVIAAYGTAKGADSGTGWGFRDLARAEVIGSTIGGGAGIAYGLLVRPTPQRNMFLSSSVIWGAAIGYEFGGGGTGSGNPWAETRDGVALGGLVGYNVALVGAAGVSAFWSPSWNQLGWMWGGFSVGEAVSTLVYPFYAATHNDPRRGLIFQGVLGTVGTVAGAFIGHPERPGMMAEQEHEDEMYWHRHHFARVRGGSLMPVQGGAGAMVTGELW
jgi:hypothetical protein